MKSILFWPFSALVLGAYPVLYTYSVNLGSVDAAIIVTPMIVVVATAALLNLVCAFILRSWSKGALVADFILFSSYLSNSLIETLFPWVYVSSFGKPVACATIACIFSGAWAIGRRLRRAHGLPRWTVAANLCSLMLMTIPIFQIGWFHWMVTTQQASAGKPPEEKTFSHARPSVYYIILDGYAREDILARDLGYDNSRFIRFLKRNGFFVARKSRSNYAYTYLSLASSLNMDYINELDGAPDQEQECIRRIHESSVLRLFRMKGYQGHPFCAQLDCSRGGDPYTETTFNPRTVNEFENLVLKRFLLRPFLKQGIMNMYKARTLYTLHRLEAICHRNRTPNFVFAHILCPHPPLSSIVMETCPNPRSTLTARRDRMTGIRKNATRTRSTILNHLVEETVDSIF